MKNDFNLKQYLVENKLTRNSRLLNETPEQDDFLGAPAEPAPTPSEPSGDIDLETAKQLIFNTKGKIFTVSFIKKDGTNRVLNGRLGVKKWLKGGELRYNPSDFGMIPVWDIQANGYRMINTNTINGLNIGGRKYNVSNAIAESREEEEMVCENIYGNNDDNIENLTPLQQKIYAFEKEVSSNPEEFIDDISQLQSISDAHDYYSIKRGWLEDSSLRFVLNDLIKYIT